MKISLVVIGLALVCLQMTAGENTYHRIISWKPLEKVSLNAAETLVRASFKGARYEMDNAGMPIYSEVFPLTGHSSDFSAYIDHAVFDVAPEGFELIEGLGHVGPELELSANLVLDRKMPYAHCSFIPVRVNPFNGQYEILISFDIVIRATENQNITRSGQSNYAANSVLASGDWYKFSVYQTGIHQITYADLQAMGINPAVIDPRKIRIYGNGGGMLPESLDDFRHDDLAENTIYISGESDGKFDQQDVILFYGESPHVWKYQAFSQAFNHEQNYYSDSTHYFLNFDLGPGKRIASLPSITEPPSVYVNKFTDYAYHERDLFNLSNIGRVWYGEVFDVTTSYDFNFEFPGIDLSSPAYFRAYIAAKSETTTTFNFYNGSEGIMSANISGIPSSANTFARPYIGSDWFTPSSSNVNIRITYQKNISSSVGWLNFFEINVTRNLVFTGAQMSFRDPVSVSPGNIAEFSLGNAGQNVQIWNVSDPTHVYRVVFSLPTSATT